MPRDDTPDLELAGISLRLVERYLAGICSAGETDAVEQWVAGDPKRADALQAIGRALEGVRPARDVDAALARVLTRAKASAHSESLVLHRQPGPTHRHRWLRQRVVPFATGLLAAAAVVLIATRLRVQLPIVRGREYVTAPGQRETVTLADGSQFTLAPASRVRVDAAYGRRQRDVELVEGEAYFAVTHDPAHPFFVHARNAVAQDVGTAFDVRAYGVDSTVRVAVTDGRVALGATSLTVGDLATVNRTGRATVVHGVDVRSISAWHTGRLEFVDAPALEVAATLSRWYAIDLVVADQALATQRVTMTVAADERPSDALDRLAAVLPAKVQYRGLTVTLVHP